MTSPAVDAIRRRRARINGGLLWRVAWRLLVALAALVVLEVDLLVDDLRREGMDHLRALETDEQLQVALMSWTVIALALTIGMQVLRVLRARAVQVPPTRHHRGIPGLGAAIVATWWVAPAWALALESRANNSAGASWLLLDVLAVVLLVVGVLATRIASTVELREDELRWRGRTADFVPGGVPEADVMPIVWEQALIRVSFRLVGFAIWIMLSTVAGSPGALGVAIVWAGFQLRSARRVEERSWRWRDVRLVALEGGVPAIVATGEGVLDLAPMLSATSRNESMVWTIAELARRAGAGDDVHTVDDQLRTLAREAAAATRPQATGPITMRPTAAHAFRGRLASKPSLILGIIVIALFGLSALTGNLESMLIFFGVVVTLAVIFISLGIRASRMRIEVTATELVITGVRRTRRFPRDSIGALLAVPVMQQPGPGETRIDIDGIVVDRTGAFLARLRGGDWSPEQVDELAAALGVPTCVVQDVLPITALGHAFLGYAPTWEREPGKFGVILALVIVGIVSAGVIAFEWDEFGTDDRDPAVTAAWRADREFRDEVDDLVKATFPVRESEGGRPSGCVDPAGGSQVLDDCPIAIPIRTAVLAVSGQDPDLATRALCRCTPSEFGFSRASSIMDPTAEPGSSAELSPPPDAPRIVVEATLTQDDGTVKLLLDVRRDELDDLVIHEVRCRRDPALLLSQARAETTPASLRCTPEPSRDERDPSNVSPAAR